MLEPHFSAVRSIDAVRACGVWRRLDLHPRSNHRPPRRHLDTRQQRSSGDFAIGERHDRRSSGVVNGRVRRWPSQSSTRSTGIDRTCSACAFESRSSFVSPAKARILERLDAFDVRCHWNHRDDAASRGERCASRAGPRHDEGDGLGVRGSKRIDAMSWSSSARSAADAPGMDIVSITTRRPSTSMMYTALCIPPP